MNVLSARLREAGAAAPWISRNGHPRGFAVSVVANDFDLDLATEFYKYAASVPRPAKATQAQLVSNSTFGWRPQRFERTI
jgi:hypothetical protein